MSPQVNQAGVYILTVTNLTNGCSAQSSVEVFADFVEPLADAGQTATLGCGDQNTFLDASNSISGPNIEYNWSTTNGVILSGLNAAGVEVGGPGLYTITVTNTANGCTSSASVEVIQLDDLQASVDQDGFILCNGEATGSASVQASNGTAPFTYQWSNGCLLYTSPSPRDRTRSRMPSSA